VYTPLLILSRTWIKLFLKKSELYFLYEGFHASLRVSFIPFQVFAREIILLAFSVKVVHSVHCMSDNVYIAYSIFCKDLISAFMISSDIILLSVYIVEVQQRKKFV
jgi:hypothetical protein